MGDFGIDVSKWQGKIDWQNVKNSGVKFAMIRSGWGKESPAQKDKYFEENYANAKNFQIPVGTYHYSYADSTNDAILEAQFCLKNIAQKQLEYPVAYDVEDRTMLSLTTQQRIDICRAFCETLENAGYYAMIYCSLDWYKNFLLGDELAKKYDIWLAHWYAESPGVSCGIWQYSSIEKINGISSNVDGDISYKDYPKIMKLKGLNGFSPESESRTYVVKSGDTLWKISEKLLGNGTEYVKIKQLNNLKSDVIFPGQMLKVPQ